MKKIDKAKETFLNKLRKKYGVKKPEPSKDMVEHRLIRDRQWDALETMLEAAQINNDKVSGEKIADMMNKQHELSDEKVDNFIESFGKKKSAEA